MRICEYKKYKALSLTELLIVLVIVALLFAAMAPIVTKRRTVQSYESESVWNFLPNDNDYSSYYDPGVLAWSSSLYAGYEPTGTETNPGKMVINTGDVTYAGTTYPQYHMQFRYGNGRGVPAGVLQFDSNQNLSLGYAHPKVNSQKYTTVAGNSALKNTNNRANTIAIGDSALANAGFLPNPAGNSYDMIAVGTRAGENTGSTAAAPTASSDNIFIGSGAGASEARPQSTIAIGYNAMSRTGGRSSVYVGSEAGAFYKSGSDNLLNTIIGTSFRPTKPYNTIIGYKAYSQGDEDISKLTAIGYGACNSITTDYKGSNTCIGYNSGAFNNGTTPKAYNTENSEHIFIGGTPLGGSGKNFGGRSVLEVHRTPLGSDKIRGTVILNSNLVVRGNFYSGNSDIKNFNKMNIGYKKLSSYDYYQCKSDKYFADFYEKNDIYSGFACASDTGESVGAVNSPSKNIFTFDEELNMSTSASYPSFITNPSSSDLRLKTNITPSDAGLAQILALKPYYFTFKNDTDKTLHVGVMAQDLQKVFPNSVVEDKHGYLRIKIDEMFYALINSIKTLNAKIASLNDKIKEQLSEIKSVKASHKNIKKRISVLNNRIKKLERNK